MRLFFISLLGLSSFALAQPVSFGLMGGASLTQDFQNDIFIYQAGLPLTNVSTPRRYIVGGMLELRLPLHLSIEVDGLYHELGFKSAQVEPNGTLVGGYSLPVVTWEFPVLAKYRFSLPLVKPFVDAGPTFRTAGNLNLTRPSHDGFAAGAGIEARVWKIKIAPQFRYIRWAVDAAGSSHFAPLTKPDQIEFLVSLSY